MGKYKIGFFFGAGAEIGYGLPSGGTFALDLFRTPIEADKEQFRNQLILIKKLTNILKKFHSYCRMIIQ